MVKVQVTQVLIIKTITIAEAESVICKWKRLNKACVKTMKHGNAVGTWHNRRTHYKSYQNFCKEFEYAPFPAKDWQYVQYAQFLAWQRKAPGTVDNYVSTVRTLHKLQNLEIPQAGQIHYKLVSDGIKKLCTQPVKQAEPMNHEVLLLIFRQVNFNEELEAVAWVAVLVGFTLVLRVSNLGPVARGKFDENINLVRADLQWRKGYWSIGIRWSKTIQLRNRIVWTPLIPGKYKEICPQYWVQKMLKIIPAAQQEPLFLVRENDSRYPLTSKQVNRMLKKWTKQAGLQDNRYTGHCLRRGGLNWAHDSKISGESLNIFGDWASNAYMRYLDLDFDSRVKTAKKMAKAVTIKV